MELVFNELSAQQLNSIPEARAVMSRLIQVLRSATVNGIQRVLRSSEEFGATLLAPDYTLFQWRNDPQVDKDEKTFLRLLTTRYPILYDLADMARTALNFDWTLDQRAAVGLGIAVLLDTIAVSFGTAEEWNAPIITLDCASLDDGGEIVHDSVAARHAARTDHIDQHVLWIRQRIRSEARNGNDLVQRRAELLPRLDFCGDSLEQLRGLGDGHPMLHAVLKKLFSFQEYASTWNEGRIDLSKLPMKVTPESKRTLEAFPNSRTFPCPDGSNKDFQWHARITPGAWRIHFAWNENQRRIMIGYIGAHLPTANDPT